MVQDGENYRLEFKRIHCQAEPEGEKLDLEEFF
jgi:hypothetical protein